MTLARDGKEESIQGRLLQWGFVAGREIGLHAEHNKHKWEFIAEEQGWGEWIEYC